MSGFGLTSNAGENRQPLRPRRKPWFRRWSSVLFTAMLKAIRPNSSWRSALGFSGRRPRSCRCTDGRRAAGHRRRTSCVIRGAADALRRERAAGTYELLVAVGQAGERTGLSLERVASTWTTHGSRTTQATPGTPARGSGWSGGLLQHAATDVWHES